MKANKNYLNGAEVSDVDRFRYSSGAKDFVNYGYKKLFEGIGKGLDYIFDKLGINQIVEYANPGYAYAAERKPAEWEYRSKLLNEALGSG